MRLCERHKSAFIRQVMDGIPKYNADALYEEIRKEATALLPSDVATLWKLRPEWVNKEFFACGWPLGSVQIPSDGKGKFKASQDLKERLDVASRTAKEMEEQRKLLERKLRMSILKITSTSALATMYPDFLKFIPKDEKPINPRQLPTTTALVEELKAAGWKA